jgi:hypothetical protein
VKSTLSKINTINDPNVPISIETLQSVNQVFFDLRDRVQAAGRKDLWGTSEPEAKG